VLDGVYGYSFNCKSREEDNTGYMMHQGDGGELYSRRTSRGKQSSVARAVPNLAGSESYAATFVGVSSRPRHI
jgi:hypothetical protein